MKWVEGQHPRREDGRFRRKGAPGGWVETVSDSMTRGHTPTRGRDVRGEIDPSWPVPRGERGEPDPALGEIVKLQGFDGLPEVISRDEMDRRVASGWSEVWRGLEEYRVRESDQAGSRTRVVSAVDNAEQYRSGPYYPGVGVFGSGTYASVDPQTALAYVSGPLGEDYASTPGIVRIALRPDARVIDFDDLLEQYPDLDVPRRPGQRGVLQDAGRLAAALGYDAIGAQPRNANYRDGRIMYWVILNRTAVAVQEAQ